ncbi:aquaporin-like protein [Crepidotus variabilis]|uniref:Aquaporin-like protein n=1 Tax=Crepidotus variabilis TaxID=179855 RepID=A0A9P6JJG4_9AGAR|nr:aquaporin-like protein [Crepidotus variabilis]
MSQTNQLSPVVSSHSTTSTHVHTSTHMGDHETYYQSSVTSKRFPSTIARLLKPRKAFNHIRHVLHQELAEFFGMTVFIFFGTAVNCQVVLSTNTGIASSPKGEFLSQTLGWGIGLAIGAWVSGGISGGHLNPAVTLAMATWRGFPWRRVPGYIFAQLWGGIVGAGLVYGTYHEAINIFEGGRGRRTSATASMFVTYALEYPSAATCFFTEFLGTAILVFTVMATTNKKLKVVAESVGLLPLALFLVLTGLSSAFGMQTSWAFNPARDFGPRVLLSFVGYGKQLYTYRNEYWIWCPIMAPFLGGQVAAAFYEVFVSGNWADDEQISPIHSKKATMSNAVPV